MVFKKIFPSILILVISLIFSSSFVTAETYEYDDLNRLTRVQYSATQWIEYSYDIAGNRLSEHVFLEDIESPVPDVDQLPEVKAIGSKVILIPPTATDKIVGKIIGTTTDPTIYTTPGAYTVIWTYNDGNGNISSQSQTVIVGDSSSLSCLITPQTDNSYDDIRPQINDNGHIVWQGYDGSDNEIFLYDGISITQLTNNSYDDEWPQINNNAEVVWQGYDGSDNEIFLYDGISIVQLTGNPYNDNLPQINNNGLVVWEGYDGSDLEIILYDRINITKLTNNSYTDGHPYINDSIEVVWIVYTFLGYEIFLKDDMSITQLTNNSYDDLVDQVNNNGFVVWHGWDGTDWEIFFYDGISVTQLTDNFYDDKFPGINDNGYIVWQGYDGSDNEIFLYDGISITQLTNNSYNDEWPQINNNGSVIWHGWDGSDYEIFLYLRDNVPPTAICQDMTVQLDTEGKAYITTDQIDNGSYDNCGIASVSVSFESFTCADLGDNSVVMTVTDTSDNTSQCTATVTVVDSFAPEPDIDPLPEVKAKGNVTLIPPTATDNCTGSITAMTSYPITYTTPGTYTVRWFYFDGNGNFFSQPQTVIVGEGPSLSCLITQLTNNSYDDVSPKINNSGYVVWQSNDGSNYEIFLYDGLSITQLTDSVFDNKHPQINNNGDVVWERYDSSDYEILLYDGTSIIQLTDNSYNDASPQINDNRNVVWDSSNGIVLYDGIDLIHVTEKGLDRFPKINDNGFIVWIEGFLRFQNVLLHNGISTTYLTMYPYTYYTPEINNNGYVIWHDGIGRLFFYDGVSTAQLAENVSLFGDPQINNNGYIVWAGDDDGSDSEIFLYDGLRTIKLTNNLYDDYAPQINDNGNIVWHGSTGLGDEIFIYNGLGITQLTNNTYDDRFPQINDNGDVIWRGYDGLDDEIFLYSQDNMPPKARCRNITIQLDSTGNANITPDKIYIGSKDNCDIASISVTPDIFTCADIGDNNVVLTVMNSTSGDISECAATVTIVDNLAPVPHIDPLPEVRGAENIILIPPTATDNCAGIITATTSDPTTYTIPGTYSVTWTYNDNNGNTSQQIQQVIIEIHLSPGENIQEAINIAGYRAEIILAQGTYTGTINFNGKAITIRSENPDDTEVVAATLINAGELGSVVTFNSGEGSGSVLSGITIENGNSENGGGIYCNGASPVITKCNIGLNKANKDGGGIYCISASPLISECSISGNSASDGRGGGIFCDTNSSPVIQRCYITNNDGYLGGGISGFRLGSSMKIINCLIEGNTAHKGAGIFFEQDCSPDIINCTITNNKANKDTPGIGGGICLYAESSPIITNCILWDNTASEGNEIYFENSYPSIYYSNIKGGWTGTGSKNIYADPLFVDSGPGNYNLWMASPCINNGTSVDAPYIDIGGNLRPQCDRHDMGAYEFKGDLNCDGWVNDIDIQHCIDLILRYDQFEYSEFEPADLNNDGKVNASDLVLLFHVALRINKYPIAYNKFIDTHEDTPINITLTVSDMEPDPLTHMVVTEPSHGTLSGEEPNLTYTPNANYNGTDSFTFKANDGYVDSNIATVSITITPVNDPPVANSQTLNIQEDYNIYGTLSATDIDGDGLTYSIVINGDKGNAIITNPSTGSFTYSPNKDVNGTDTFSFKANDGSEDSNIAIVSITITPINDPPVANSKRLVIGKNTANSIKLIGSDVDGDILIYTIVTQPSNGILSGTAPNITYTPYNNYSGPDSFSFKVNDGIADSNIADVRIAIYLNAHPVDCTVYEDAEDGNTNGWIIYDNDPSGASISNVFDTDRQSRVIELTRASREYCYLLQMADGSKWNNSSQFLFRWYMKYFSYFIVYININTTAGYKYLYYTPVDYNNLGDVSYIHHGLGSRATDGEWYSLQRDLQADLEEAQPGVSILEVNSFMIYGSGRVDDIMLCNTISTDTNTQVGLISMSMELPKGWSLFSVPVRFENKTVNDVFGNNAQVVYGYDKDHGYIRVKTDEELKIGNGYWVCLFEAEEYTFTGESIDSYERDEDSGWCIIGGTSKQGILSIENGSIGVIYGYKQGIGYERVKESDNIEPGKGYWVLITDITADSTIFTVTSVEE